jgi:uncharacterized protein (DUF305 family)
MNRTTTLPRRRRVLLAGAAAGISLLLTACGGGDDGASADTGSPAGDATTAAATFNDADVMFAQQMITHHQQVVDMAELAEKNAKSPELKTLATDMKTGDAAVVQQLTTMLTTWGKPTTMESMDHGSMPGMTSEKDMQMLESMKGTEFDRMFIQMMIAHHNGSMQMTMEQKSNGSNAEAKTLADEMHTTQTTQVAQLEKVLDGLA